MESFSETEANVGLDSENPSLSVQVEAESADTIDLLSQLPEELLERILLHLPIETMKTSRSVCKKWKHMIEHSVFKKKAIQMSVYSFGGLSEHEKYKTMYDWWIYYIICKHDPFNRNLLKNHCGQEEYFLQEWRVNDYKRGGNWKLENCPVGVDPLPNHPDFEGHTCCFVPRAIAAYRSQRVIFRDWGLSDKIMDEYQPKILVSDWYAGSVKFRNHSLYLMNGVLLDASHDLIADVSTKKMELNSSNQWQKIELTLENYGPYARYCTFEEFASDMRWNIHTRPMLSGACIKICLPTRNISQSKCDSNIHEPK